MVNAFCKNSFNLKHCATGDTPSITKTINSFQPKTVNGKAFKRSAQTVNFLVHDAGRTAVDSVLASETIGLKSAETSGREVKNHLTQKYSRVAVDNYNRGTIFIGRTAIDAIRGTKNHFKSKKQYRLEKAKFKLKKAEYTVFKEDTFKPKIKSNKSDLKSAKAEMKQHKQNYKNGSKSNIQKAFLIRRKQQFKVNKRKYRKIN